MKKTLLLLVVAIFVTACSGSVIHNPPHVSVKDQPREVQELHSNVAMFLRAWYWKKDQRQFWQMISRHGPLDRNRDGQLFFDAFTKPLDQVFPGNRKMSGDTMRANAKNNSEIEILNANHASFVIARMDIFKLTNDPEFHTHSEKEESFITTLPTMPYLVVLYEIQGEGFTSGYVTMIWVREISGWKIWDIWFE